eukprot:UN15696
MSFNNRSHFPFALLRIIAATLSSVFTFLLASPISISSFFSRSDNSFIFYYHHSSMFSNRFLFCQPPHGTRLPAHAAHLKSS